MKKLIAVTIITLSAFVTALYLEGRVNCDDPITDTEVTYCYQDTLSE